MPFETTTITLPIEQFIGLLVTIVAAAVAVVIWIHNRTDKLRTEFDLKLKSLDDIVRGIQINFPTRVDSIDTLIEVIREDIKDLKKKNE